MARPTTLYFQMDESPPILKLDISRYQANRNVSPVVHFDFDSFEAMGGQVMSIRGSVNNVGTDFEFYHNATECDSRGIVFDSYNPVALWENLDQQADRIADLIKDMQQSQWYSKQSWLDLERNYNLTKLVFTERAWKVAKKVYDRCGEWLGIYTGAYFWNANVDRMHVDSFKDLSYWTAHYFPGLDPFQVPDARPYCPHSWADINNPKEPDWWQFDTNDNGYAWGSRGDDEVDVNFFTFQGGTYNAFEKRYGFKLKEDIPPVPPPPPPPPPQPGLITLEITAESWNVREGPTTNSRDVGDLKKGDVIVVEGNWYGDNAWAKILSGEYEGKYFAVSWKNSSNVVVRSAEPV